MMTERAKQKFMIHFFSRIFSRAPLLWLSLFLCTSAICVYANTFHNQMFWDDNDFILDNAYIKNISNFPKFWTENLIAGSGLLSNYYRPTLLSVFSIEWHLWGNNPIGYHVTNTLFHAANGVLLFLLLFTCFKKKSLAFFTALIFVIHPLQTEAVSYANSLGDSLSVFFVLIGLNLLAQTKDRPPLQGFFLTLAAALSYILAQTSKETGIIFGPLAFLVLLTIYRTAHWKQKVEELIKKLLPVGVLTITYLALRAGPLNFKNSFNLYDTPTDYSSNILVRLYTFCKIIFTYLGLIFWPQHLHMERGVSPILSYTSPWVWAGAALILALLIAAWLLRKRALPVSFGIIWFFICLIPISNILVPINGQLYEHWLYLALSGIALAVIYLLSLLWRYLPSLQITIAVISIFAIGTLSIRTVLRNQEWATAIGFYKQTLNYAPHSYRLWNNLGMEYAEAKQTEKALDAYNEAIKLDPANPVALYNRANLIRDQGDLLGAISVYEQILGIDPYFYYAYPNLANAYQRLGKKQEFNLTIERWKQASQSKPK